MQIGFSGLLFAIFLTLRLTDYIDWAWYWVASPLWIPLLIVMPLMLLGCLISSGYSKR